MPLTLQDITDGFKKRARSTDGLEWGVLRFDMGTDGVLTIDGTKKPNKVSNDASVKADCVITLSLQTLSKMVTGLVDNVGTDLKIKGDLRVAMALGPAGTDQPTPRMDRKAGDRGILLPLPATAAATEIGGDPDMDSPSPPQRQEE